MGQKHEKLVNDILLALGSQPDIRCWRTWVGKAQLLYQRRVITVGPEGVGDIEGIIAPSGRYFTIECKVGKDTQRDSQLTFERIVRTMGGLYIVAYSVEDAREGICGRTDYH